MDKHDLFVEWIKKAKNDLGTAKLIVDNEIIYTDQVCYHSQQVVEKCLKALLIVNGDKIVKTHNLAYLLNIVSNHIEIPEEYYDYADVLDAYSVDVGYPMGDFEPTENEALEAFSMASKVFDYISNL